MKIKLRWGRHIDGVTIQEFARMDIPPSTPDHAGFYNDCVSILIPSQIGTIAILHIARGEDGYHVARGYETRTGGCISRPGRSSKAYLNKIDAFKSGLKWLEEDQYIAFNRKYADQACRIYYDALHKQLTLF